MRTYQVNSYRKRGYVYVPVVNDDPTTPPTGHEVLFGEASAAEHRHVLAEASDWRAFVAGDHQILVDFVRYDRQAVALCDLEDAQLGSISKLKNIYIGKKLRPRKMTFNIIPTRFYVLQFRSAIERLAR